MAKSILMSQPVSMRNWQPSLKSVGEEFTIITGGALGADSLAEECAKEWGMNVELKLCPHHHRVSEAQPSLTRSQLSRVADKVSIAGYRLGRQPTKNPFVRDLLARNWYIVHDACVLYAHGRFEDDSFTTVEGGTGWTVQMCVDHNREYPDLWKPLFVYDEGRMEWYELEVQTKRNMSSDTPKRLVTYVLTHVFRVPFFILVVLSWDIESWGNVVKIP